MVHTLSTTVLPAPFGLWRDLPPRAEDPDHPGWQRYDRDTLIYDAVHLPGENLVRVYLPRTYNLSGIVRGASFLIDGRPAPKPRHRTNRRFETLDFSVGARAPSVVTMKTDRLGEISTQVARGDGDLFAGRNVLYTMLSNERLEWIRDWMSFHRKEHGADAVLIAHNVTEAYTSAELEDAIRSVPGFRAAEVITVPLPWGPSHREKGVDDGKFLQTTLLNLARDRFLMRARAVLNCDVDELVVRTGDRSIFDAADRWGYATFWGKWYYPAGSIDHPRHADHRLFDPGQKRCPTKFVFRPDSLLGRRCLSVHSLERLNRRIFAERSEFSFIHCWSVSNSWKFDRRSTMRQNLVEDPEVRALLARTIG